ncbi:MAG: hypothetical protein LC793_07325 [Thermomicrobia bacterium]|nr:hypothetical protein [Thermomicrobia bacterium]
MVKTVGWTIVVMGILLLGYEFWSVAPLLVAAIFVLLMGCVAILLSEAAVRIRDQRYRWEAAQEELKARNVDDEVEMTDEEGAFV